MVILIPASEQTNEMLLKKSLSSNDIKASEVHEYIDKYKQRIEKLDSLTKNETGIGRIDSKKETMGWRFPAGELKDYVNTLEDDSELLVLFGVGKDMLTHVIITEPGAIRILKSASQTGSTNDPVVGKEHGSSCCGTKSINECFDELFA